MYCGIRLETEATQPSLLTCCLISQRPFSFCDYMTCQLLSNMQGTLLNDLLPRIPRSVTQPTYPHSTCTN